MHDDVGEPVYYLAAWQTPRASSNSAAKKIFHEREKAIGTAKDVAALRSDVLTVLGPDTSFVVEDGMLTIEVPDSRLRAASADLLSVVAAAGYILYDPQVGRLVVPMTKMVAPWPPEWTRPIAELREALAAAMAGVDEPGEVDMKAFMTDLAAEKEWETWQVGDPLPPDVELRSHVAPDLEALIPPGLVDSKDAPTSVRATDYGAPTVNRALKAVGVRPRDAVVVSTLGGEGQDVHTVTIFGVPGVAADALAAAFERTIYKPRSVRWEPREIEGRSVWWAEAKGYLQGDDFIAVWWARDGLVFWITGPPAWLRRAIAALDLT